MSNAFHRRSIRLKGYDYSQPGAYFITIVTQQKQSLFSTTHEEKRSLNEAGEMILNWMNEVTKKFIGANINSLVIMPDHVHFILEISEFSIGADLCVCPKDREAKQPTSVSTVIQWFKTMTTDSYIKGVRQLGWEPFNGRLWQRNYYEHIIRDQKEWDRIHAYIIANPTRQDDIP